MITELPYYELTCNCGMRIRGNNENGVVSLLKKHIESGKFHTGYLLVNKLEPGGSELENILKEATAMKKGL